MLLTDSTAQNIRPREKRQDTENGIYSFLLWDAGDKT